MCELFASSVSSMGPGGGGGGEKDNALLLFSNVHKSSIVVIVYIIFSIKPLAQQGRSRKWKQDAIKRGGNIQMYSSKREGRDGEASGCRNKGGVEKAIFASFRVIRCDYDKI